jgi:hypothetical protein
MCVLPIVFFRQGLLSRGIRLKEANRENGQIEIPELAQDAS